MSEILSNPEAANPTKKDNGAIIRHDDVPHREAAANERNPTAAEHDIPQKKRKTRRGKSKRKYPYSKDRKSTKIVKAEAPYNSNQFLLEDHGNIEELDEKLKCVDQASTSTINRTRDSSFSVDSDGEFYSSPDDEEQFLIKDFDDQYESIQAERLNNMNKNDLIQEYLMLQSKVEMLSKKLKKRFEKDLDDTDPSLNCSDESATNKAQLQMEVERLTIENENLRRENCVLRRKVSEDCSSSSEDSETDSSDSCSSSASSSSVSAAEDLDTLEESPQNHVIDHSQTNGQDSSHAVSFD